MPATVSPTPARSTQGLLAELRALVKHNNQRARRLILWREMSLATAAVLGIFLATLVADQYLHLPPFGRFAAFFILIGCFVALVGRAVILWRRTAFTEDGIALAIEERTENLDNRLINALQLSRESRGVGFHDAVIRENHQRLQEARVKSAVSLRPVLLGAGAVGVICLLGAFFWWKDGNQFTNSAARILLPLSDRSPLYRTVLLIEPGDGQATKGSDVRLRIRVQGEIPKEMAVAYSRDGKNEVETIRLTPGSTEAAYVFRQVRGDVTYSVRAGDFRSPIYTILVPAPPAIRSVRVEILPPAYTKLPPRRLESSSGHLEALAGSELRLHFELDRPVEKAALILERPVPESPDRVELRAINASEFAGELRVENLSGYRLALTKDGETVESPAYGIRLLPDQPPRPELTGIEEGSEAEADWILPLTLTAEDDYGLARTAIAFRAASATPEAWQIITEWPVKEGNRWKETYPLDLAALNLTEGDRIEVALLARDHDPAKDQWAESEPRLLAIGGESAQLQIFYEQLLRTEADLRGLTTRQEKLGEGATEWIRKLESSSGLRWDDQANLDALRQATAGLATRQEEARQSAGTIARAMPEATGNLRLSLGMLADTEMIRSTQILESAPRQDHPQAMRAALTEAQMTQNRTAQSLKELLQQFVRFREDWENDQMTNFLGMLAARQMALEQESLVREKETGSAEAMIARRARSAANRQTRLVAVTALAQKALVGVAARVLPASSGLGAAFADAARALDEARLKVPMQTAAELLERREWAGAAAEQKKAAEILQQLYVNLKMAATAALRGVPAVGSEDSGLEGQAAIDALREGSSEDPVESADQSVSTLVKMAETKQSGKAPGGESAVDATQFLLDEKMKEFLAVQGNAGAARPANIVSLATRPGGPTIRSPNFDNLPPNAITAPPIPDQLHDLVGALLDEADEMSDQYDTLNANSALTAIDAGEIQKSGGRLNSHAAVSKTGNQKPPTSDSGGASGTGRQGARSHGKSVDDVAINRRGRDEAQEGQEEAPMQAGKLKEIMSNDPQMDSSTGVGGKSVDAPETDWSKKDAGQWQDKWAKNMSSPQSVAKAVDRQGPPMDPKVADLLRDLTGTQEQMIKRMKAIRKELKSLFLPTDRLDDLITRMEDQTSRLKLSPEPGLFREQQETLDSLRQELRTMERAAAGFHPSLPRPRGLKGPALAEPAARPLPGYEEAVRTYYEILATQ